MSSRSEIQKLTLTRNSHEKELALTELVVGIEDIQPGDIVLNLTSTNMRKLVNFTKSIWTNSLIIARRPASGTAIDGNHEKIILTDFVMYSMHHGLITTKNYATCKLGKKDISRHCSSCVSENWCDNDLKFRILR